MKPGIEFNKRTEVFSESASYCHMAQPSDFITTSTWHNGEGIDIQVQSSMGLQTLSITHGELELINVLAYIKEPT